MSPRTENGIVSQHGSAAINVATPQIAASIGDFGQVNLRDVAQAVVGKIRAAAERIGHRRVTPGGRIQRVARDLFFSQPQRDGRDSPSTQVIEN